jgi:hypothetical protein
MRIEVAERWTRGLRTLPKKENDERLCFGLHLPYSDG